MDKIILDPIESANINRFAAVTNVLSFSLESLQGEIEVTEGEISAMGAQLDFYKKKLAHYSDAVSKLKAEKDSAEKSLMEAVSGAVQRLGEEANPGNYRAEHAEDGTIVALTKVQD